MKELNELEQFKKRISSIISPHSKILEIGYIYESINIKKPVAIVKEHLPNKIVISEYSIKGNSIISQTILIKEER
jgi:hypothetical protein